MARVTRETVAEEVKGIVAEVGRYLGRRALIEALQHVAHQYVLRVPVKEGLAYLRQLRVALSYAHAYGKVKDTE